MKYLSKITGTIPYTTKEVDINVNGKHLIITGGNGSGKTSFIKDLYEKINFFITDKKTFEEEENRYNFRKKEYQESKNTSMEKWRLDDFLKQKKVLDFLKSNTKIDFIDKDNLIQNSNKIIHFFDDSRTSEIEAPNGIENTSKKTELNKKDFEKHLVYLKSQQSFSMTEENDINKSNQIKKWFDDLEYNIKHLLEDDSFILKFISTDTKFILKQNNKDAYTFQNLSRGYSAIFAVFADILMKIEFLKILPQELEGIVLIDEIDAHLHVSLQRKILPFLTKSFPNLQFVVTTHSPFIISSISDVVIYDLSSKETYQDLTNYSYESIIEGLLNTDIISKKLENQIDELCELTENPPYEYDKIQNIITDIEKNDSNLTKQEPLDIKSKTFLYKAKNIILKLKKLGDKSNV